MNKSKQTKQKIVVDVRNVYKDFMLPHEKNDSIKTKTTSIFKKKNRSVSIQQALKDITFNVKEGEFFGIVGRNGSGKSTLLKILAGIYQPTHGSVTTVGKLVPFIELGVGFNPELTGRENVYLNGAMLGFSEVEIDAQYNRIVEFAELENFMDQKLKNYSSGMQVRLAFSVATTSKADILLVDEVLAVGDADFQRKCFSYFRSLKKQKKTVIFVSHDMNAVREYCDRAILIEESKLVEEGSSAKVAQAYSHLFMGEVMEASEDVTDKLQKPLRWGGGQIKYDSIEIIPSIIKDEPNITIATRAVVREDVDGAILGFSIKNSADALLFGTNTQLLGKRLINLKKGEQLELKWMIPNIFNDGDYLLNATIETDAAEPCDWWEEAVKISVRKESQTGFIVYPDVNVVVNHVKTP